MTDLQTTYYIVGIIFMVLYGLLLIGIAVLLFYIWRKISILATMIDERLQDLKQLTSHPEEVVSHVGDALADTAIHQIKKIFQHSKNE